MKLMMTVRRYILYELTSIEDIREDLNGCVEERLQLLTVEERLDRRKGSSSLEAGIEVGKGWRGTVRHFLRVNSCLCQSLHWLGYVTGVLEPML